MRGESLLVQTAASRCVQWGFRELEVTREKLCLLEDGYEANRREQGGDQHVRELSMKSLKGLINQLKEERRDCSL